MSHELIDATLRKSVLGWLATKMNRWNLLADLFRSPKQFAKTVQISAVQQHAKACGNVTELAVAALESTPTSARCTTISTPLYGAKEFEQCRQLISRGLLSGHCNALCVQWPWQQPGGSSEQQQVHSREQHLAGRCVVSLAGKAKLGEQPLVVPLDLFAHCASGANMLAHLRSLDPTSSAPAEAILGRDALAMATTGLQSTITPHVELNLHPDVAAALAARLAADAVVHVERIAGAQTAGGKGKPPGGRLPLQLMERWHKLAEAEAELYFRQLLQSGAKPWSMRQRHMMQVLQSAMSYLESSGAGSTGQPPGVVVWGHTSSLGAASSCELGWKRGDVNLGQLLKEQLPKEALFSIGFSTHTGGFLAGGLQAAGAVRPVQLPPSLAGSYEEVLHSSGVPVFALDLREGRVKEVFEFPMLTRVVGEEYQGAAERSGQYWDASLPGLFDVLLHVDVVSAAATVVS